MNYLQRLKALDSEKVATVNTALTAKSPIDQSFDSFDSTHTGHFSESSPNSTATNPRDAFDDRRYCHECSNLTNKGRCLAAWRGDILAGSHYHPIDDIPRRCVGFSPKANDYDQRTGRQRWPGLNSITVT
jgi:hypothetical protein